MADDASLPLLLEIRDLQKQQLGLLQTSMANQQQSLANQQRSLEAQQEAKERQKELLARSNRVWIMIMGVVFVLLFLSFFPLFFRMLLGHLW